jgi:hypothetical protein
LRAASFAENVSDAENQGRYRLLIVCKISALAPTRRQWKAFLEQLRLSAMSRSIFHESAACFTIRPEIVFASKHLASETI